MVSPDIKQRAVELRMLGASYEAICHELGIVIPKSTMSYWFKYIQLPEKLIEDMARTNIESLARAREVSRAVRKRRRNLQDKATLAANADLVDLIRMPRISKLTLAILYWAEGSKKTDQLKFGNSDPSMISNFLLLLRSCYRLDEDKFRCALICRADQDHDSWKCFWSGITGIGLHKFYPTQVDKRSVGKPTKKIAYKGVCVIYYFSASIARELCLIPRLFHIGPIV